MDEIVMCSIRALKSLLPSNNKSSAVPSFPGLRSFTSGNVPKPMVGNFTINRKATIKKWMREGHVDISEYRNDDNDQKRNFHNKQKTFYYTTTTISQTLTIFGALYAFYQYKKKAKLKEEAISTQLGIAVIRNDFHRAEELLVNGGIIDVNEKDKNGDTPLHHAARNGGSLKESVG